MPCFAAFPAMLHRDKMRLVGIEPNMTNQTKTFIIALALLVAVAGSEIATAAGAEHLKGRIQGSVIDNVYTNPERDFRVRVPVYEDMGGAARDETAKGSGYLISQVIFTDDFGWFYRVVSITPRKEKATIEGALYTLRDIRDKKEIQTARGRELRVINIEEQGAEVTVTTIKKGSEPKTGKPDLLTANAIFAANGRVYHLVVGFPLYEGSTKEQVTDQVNKKLEDFLVTFEAVKKNK